MGSKTLQWLATIRRFPTPAATPLLLSASWYPLSQNSPLGTQRIEYGSQGPIGLRANHSRYSKATPHILSWCTQPNVHSLRQSARSKSSDNHRDMQAESVWQLIHRSGKHNKQPSQRGSKSLLLVSRRLLGVSVLVRPDLGRGTVHLHSR